MNADQGREKVEKAVEMVHCVAARQMQQLIASTQQSKHEVGACAVLVSAAMPAWILAVHFRIHKAEGVLFPEALGQAAERCKLPLVKALEKELEACAQRHLSMTAGEIAETMAALGKSAGPPWGKDQRNAALAAMIALES